MAKAAVPAMRNRSSIIMTGSVTGLLGNKDLLDYSITKGGIHAFTRSLATHLIDRGVRVERGGAGSSMDTPQSGRQISREGCQVRERHTDEAARPARGDCPRVRVLGHPSCSSYITGEVLPIIGGYSGEVLRRRGIVNRQLLRAVSILATPGARAHSVERIVFGWLRMLRPILSGIF
jgi:hypothetical protein